MPIRKAVPPKKLSAAQRLKTMVDLRIAGCTVEQIAEQMNTSRRSVSRILVSELAKIEAETTNSLSGLKTLELARADMAMLAIAPEVRVGHLGAIDRWTKLIALKCQILGLDKPKGDAAAIIREYAGVDIEKV